MERCDDACDNRCQLELGHLRWPARDHERRPPQRRSRGKTLRHGCVCAAVNGTNVGQSVAIGQSRRRQLQHHLVDGVKGCACVDKLASNTGRQGVCVYNCTRLRVHFRLRANTTCHFVDGKTACNDTGSRPQAPASRSIYEVPAWASVIIQGNVGGSHAHHAPTPNLPHCGRVVVGAHAIAVVRAVRIAGQSNIAITVGHAASVLVDDCMIDHNEAPVRLRIRGCVWVCGCIGVCGGRHCDDL